MSAFKNCKEAHAFYEAHRPAGMIGHVVYGDGNRWFYTYEEGDGTGWEIASGPYHSKRVAEMLLAREVEEDGLEEEITDEEMAELDALLEAANRQEDDDGV